ncbi:hypothetical protein K523DRAFT_323390 [Schizophyllum commune Tattone D]|uniref:Expressed protein n=1 Tax=Schizophyllum commune (strain H4-8 / FGSC 9210) TaxID=578458 RepID=D8PN86_SCHCM|nr:uncharacterized protein SCHCODRAFT_02487290 [Schizophyllum commune H4-8]KAI4528436.1 hypothetical protein K525DRAFT_184096 [Schizophyllum commune Loenen D]KAI5825785.1 hypothetical protein K523DRAFT_323390 [Schizophyllum commune Tattone D]KAI5898621.1 hypothetical protein SCHCODRAFT_02487290 [Schizophyllum commune H4-8]
MTISRPLVSSPLAAPPSQGALPSGRPTPKRNSSFGTSRPLRPFPSISTAVKKPSVKLIQPPKNQRNQFTLDLTQAEFNRQE